MIPKEDYAPGQCPFCESTKIETKNIGHIFHGKEPPEKLCWCKCKCGKKWQEIWLLTSLTLWK